MDFRLRGNDEHPLESPNVDPTWQGAKTASACFQRDISLCIGMDPMTKRNGYLVAGAFGAVVLGSMVALGYVEDRIDTRSAIGNSVSERQMLERRRGRVAEAAIVDTTVQ
ncbi:hypothetical protein ASE59_15130 [Sphingomonas sp. Leaf10]|nr:hypothetical protein ASE59_15130 [Sphingomonas sp. Leaf10]